MTLLDDIDGKAAEYVLGTLPAHERAAVAAARQQNKALDAAITAWERRLSPLLDSVEPVMPPADLYRRIDAALSQAGLSNASGGRNGAPKNVLQFTPRESMLAKRGNRWRNAFVGMTAAAASAVGVLGYRDIQNQQELPTQFVAVLDPAVEGGKGGPAFLLTVDTKTHKCVITAVNAPKQQAKSYEVWMLHDKMPAPKSLGVVAEGDMNVMPMAPGPDTDMFMNASFAVSLEPEGGSPSGAPTGPVLFTGKLVQATP